MMETGQNIHTEMQHLMNRLVLAGLAIAAETWIKPEDSLSHILVDASAEAPHEDKFQNEAAAQPADRPADQAAVVETDTQPADAPVDQGIDAGNG